METRRPPQLPQPLPFAAGLRLGKRFFPFHEYSDRDILLGRGGTCDIRVDGFYVSRIHAAVEFHDGARLLTNRSEYGCTFVDGELVKQPMRLRVGNLLVLGTSTIIATDETGWFPINNVAGVTDLFCKAIELCGGHRAAERWLGCDHSSIRRRIHRSKRRRNTRGSY